MSIEQMKNDFDTHPLGFCSFFGYLYIIMMEVPCANFSSMSLSILDLFESVFCPYFG